MKLASNELPGGGRGLLNLTAEQRQFARTDRDAWDLAQRIHDFTCSPKGGRWFSEYSLGRADHKRYLAIKKGEALGLWIKDEHKRYWRHCSYTWPWINTALAFRDEYHRSP